MDDRRDSGLALVFDADDTLWESNVHFLKSFDSFAEALAQAGVKTSRDEIQRTVRRAELEIIQSHGYGRRPYVLALHRAVDDLTSDGRRTLLHGEVRRIGLRLVEQRCELLPGVESTLVDLATRHRLLLFTKGQRDEQLEKLEQSGLRGLFCRVETPREKDTQAYRRLIAEANLDPESTYMIGNSPRSDVNPALSAGLRAVYIPYPHTWELEQEAIVRAEAERLIELSSFHRLLDLF